MGAAMTRHVLTIAGRGVDGADMAPVIDPATGREFASCPVASPAQVEEAVAAAQAAFAGWSRDLAARRAALLACAAVLDANREAVADLLVREQGKPRQDALGEVGAGIYWLQATSGLRLDPEILQDDETGLVELHRRPLGVVAAITPWNFPVALAIWKIAPALLAGNTMVLKPSPFTPLSTLLFGRLLQEALPPGVLNIVAGDDEVGKLMVAHPAIRKISFTGSVRAGKHIMASAAADLKRITLELGGNDAAIVLGDNDPAAIAERLFWGAFRNSGQICVAIKRIYVDERIYAPLRDAIAEVARNVRVGHGLDPHSQLGPVNNRPQSERVAALVDDARSRGARIDMSRHHGDDGGYFHGAAIVSEIDPDAPIVVEEQFGPAVPILPFSDVEDAVFRANDSHFGLGGSIWTPDVERGRALAAQLDCGTAWINQHARFSPFVPFGGIKWSGIGCENGDWGLAGFTDLKVVSAARN
jgi:acyl-CoA reductase-like NAD-dependent aldehyde dehydrogenase